MLRAHAGAEAFSDPTVVRAPACRRSFSAVSLFPPWTKTASGAERPARAEVAAERERSVGYVEPVAAAGAVCGVVRRRGRRNREEGRFACAPTVRRRVRLRPGPALRTMCVVRRRAGGVVCCVALRGLLRFAVRSVRRGAAGRAWAREQGRWRGVFGCVGGAAFAVTGFERRGFRGLGRAGLRPF